MPIRSRGAGVIAQTPGTWVPLWDLDCTAQDDHDLLTEGAYADTTGATTWSIANDTVNGNSFASVLGFQSGTGLVITTSGTGLISLGQTLASLLPDYTVAEGDRLLFAMDVDRSDMDTDYQYARLGFGDRDPLDSSLGITAIFNSDEYDESVIASRFVNTVEVAQYKASTHEALALSMGDQAGRAYSRASWAAPLTGWTAHERLGFNADPSSQTTLPSIADGSSWVTWAFNRLGSTNLTVTVRRMAVYGWVPLFR